MAVVVALVVAVGSVATVAAAACYQHVGAVVGNPRSRSCPLLHPCIHTPRNQPPLPFLPYASASFVLVVVTYDL